MPQEQDFEIGFAMNSVTVSRRTRDDFSYVEIAFKPWVDDGKGQVGPYKGVRLTARNQVEGENLSKPIERFLPLGADGFVKDADQNIVELLRAMSLPENALAASTAAGEPMQLHLGTQDLLWCDTTARTRVLLSVPGPVSEEGGEISFAIVNMAVPVKDMTDVARLFAGSVSFGAAPLPGAPEQAVRR